jgi:hypothetical protein
MTWITHGRPKSGVDGLTGRLSKPDPTWQRIAALHGERFENRS